MQVQSRFFWTAVALAVALVIGREWLQRDAIPLTVPLVVSPEPAAARAFVPPPAAAPSARRPEGASRLAHAFAAAMVRRYSTAPSLRAFVYEAMRKPEEGGHHYAFIALATCSYSVAPARPVAPRSAEQREAIEALARRCDMSREEMDAARTQLVASRQLNDEPDPLMPLTFDLLMAGDAPERLKAVAAILETQDPHLLWSLAEAGSAMPDEEKAKGVYFAGRYYEGGTGSGVYDYALQLAQCNFGIDCGAGSLPVLLMCIRQGWCGESLSEAMKAGLGADKAAVFEQAQALAAQLILEIKRKNARAFVRG